MTTTQEKPSRGFWGALGAVLAVLGIGTLGAGIGLIGFAVSFDTLTDIAKPVMPGNIPGSDVPWAATLPAVVDALIVFLSAMRIVKAARGKRSPVIEILEYSLIGVTVVLNATVGDTLRDRIVHAAFPAAYVIVTAVGTVVILDRFETIRRKAARDRITFARWLLATLDTFSLWRNMKIAGTGSFAVAIRLERHKIAQYRTWRRQHGAWWWLPWKVSRADRKALRLELADIAIDASRVPPGDIPAPVPARPATAPAAARPESRPAPVPRPVPVLAVPVPPPTPRPVRDTTDTAVLGVPALGDYSTPQQRRDAALAALRDFLDPAAASPFDGQAAIARAVGMSTSQVSRLAKQISVNGSAAAHG